MEPLPAPWLYFIMAEYSCQSCRAILQYVCLDGKRSVLRLITPAIRFYWRVLRSDHACCLPPSGKQERLAICFVPVPRGSGSPFVRSRGVARLSGFVGSLRDCAFLCGDPDEVRESEETRRTESTARCKYVFAQSYWLCHVFRGEYAGAEMWKPHCGRPRLRQRAIGSLDSLHLIRKKYLLPKRGNNRYPRTVAPMPATLGYTERPVRL